MDQKDLQAEANILGDKTFIQIQKIFSKKGIMLVLEPRDWISTVRNNKKIVKMVEDDLSQVIKNKVTIEEMKETYQDQAVATGSFFNISSKIFKLCII